MEKQMKKLLFFLLCFLCFTLFTGTELVQCSSHDRGLPTKKTKLFVFGDSYADTGNRNRSTNSWNAPYGITFPGKPAGRFSNGRVLTDYLASYLGIKSPVPYRMWKFGMKQEQLEHGMNFAFGGTGVFYKTLASEPNMTTQIGFLKRLIRHGIFTKQDVASSIALVSLAGNDYSDYVIKGGNAQGLPAYNGAVVNQLILNLKRIQSLGVRKIAVISLGPLGCIPEITIMSSYQQCNGTFNTAVHIHNSLLHKAVEVLNHVDDGNKDSTFVILDIYNAFFSAFKTQGNHPGSVKFENPLKPCCVGTSEEYYCGSVDKRTGAKKYIVCENPDAAFFWDGVHPTQQGWNAVYSVLHPSLNQLYS